MNDFEQTTMLVDQAQKGDREALDVLFRRYLPRVRQIVAFRMGCRPSEIERREEIVQEAMLNAFEKLGSYRPQSESRFRSWMSTCVVNSLRDHVRREGAQKRGADRVRLFGSYGSEDASAIVFAGDGPTPSVVLGRKELLERVESAILDLKEHWREVVILRLFCEMSYAEIGEEMGIREEATVRKLFSRAMGELRKRCEA